MDKFAKQQIENLDDFTDEQKQIVKLFNKAKKHRREEQKEKQKLEEAELAKSYVETDAVQIIHADFYEYCQSLDSNSVDAIITDPPYPEEFHHVWAQLGEVAARVLKPSSFLITYSGQYHLPYVINALSERLTYYWTFCLYHKGASQIVNNRNLMCKWKPILIFSNGKSKLNNTIPDYIISEKPEKDSHVWQQSDSGVSTLIDYFTNPNDLILDTFCGSGTFLVAAKNLKRRCIGIDNDINAINTAKAKWTRNIAAT